MSCPARYKLTTLRTKAALAGHAYSVSLKPKTGIVKRKAETFAARKQIGSKRQPATTTKTRIIWWETETLGNHHSKVNSSEPPHFLYAENKNEPPPSVVKSKPAFSPGDGNAKIPVDGLETAGILFATIAVMSVLISCRNVASSSLRCKNLWTIIKACVTSRGSLSLATSPRLRV